MNIAFGETHQMLRDSVRRFVERRITPHVDAWEDAGEFPRELYGQMAECGFLGLGYPEKYGGTPGDVFHRIVFLEEIMRCGSMGVVAGLGSHGIALPPILSLGNEELKLRFIPPVLAGEKIAALAVTEPVAGSDVANIQTRAVLDGEHYIVNGSKTFITSGCRADFITCAVRTGDLGHEGISLLVIESDTPGFTVTRKIEKMGWNASDTAELSFQDCRVPTRNLVGNEGAGFFGIMQNFQAERIAMSVMGYSVAQLAYDRAFAYAKEREAFGRTLSKFQITRHKLVDMAMQIDIARRYLYYTASCTTGGDYAIKEISFAKIFSAEVAEKVCREAIQILGGYGYAREFAVERLYRDARILAIGGGTTEIMKEIVWKMLETS